MVDCYLESQLSSPVLPAQALVEVSGNQVPDTLNREVLAARGQSSSDYPNLRVLRLPDVMARVGLKHASIYQRMSLGTFPPSISLGGRAVGWLEYEIEAWIANRIDLSRSLSVPVRQAAPRVSARMAARQIEHSKNIP